MSKLRLERDELPRANDLRRVELCFPRFYYYDILRGLNALTAWSEITGRPLPSDSIREVLTILEKKSAQGDLRCERTSFAGISTLLPDDKAAGLKIGRQVYFLSSRPPVP